MVQQRIAWSTFLAGGLLIASAGSGCKSPASCWHSTWRCFPGTADGSAQSFWEACGPEAGAADAVPDPATGLGSNPPSRGSDLQRDLDSLNPPVEQRDSPKHVVVRPVGYSQERSQDPLRLPSDLPGANTPPLLVPPSTSGDRADQREAIRDLFPALPDVPVAPEAMAAAGEPTMGLEDLHQLAEANHPSLRMATAAVEAARGQMIQAGLPPNPSMGYQADTVNTINTQGYQGAYLQQTLITAKKLGLAAEAAAVDYANAMIEQRKTWVEVTTGVRRAYFQVLAARQRLKLANALFELTDRAYQAQIELVAAGEAAPYEPLQLRVISTQARAAVIRAQQESIAAWRVLAAATGLPNLQVASLEGHIDCAVPSIAYEDALSRLLSVHTDILIAENATRKQRVLVTLADRTPIPNLDVGLVLQRDYTFTPGTTTYNLMLGGEVPVLNRNQGNRISTRAELIRAGQAVSETRIQLIAQLANTYGVYQANRELADSFRTDALQDQVRAYRGVYQRYLADPNGVSFNDVIVAQQTVASVLTQYLDILQSQWQSVVDLGQLLQVEDLFQLGPLVDVAEIPDLNGEEIPSQP